MPLTLFPLQRRIAILRVGRGGLVRPSGVGVAREPPAARPPPAARRPQRLCVCHTETPCVCRTETLCVDHIQEYQNLDKNHEIWSESGPYGSVRAHIQPESIPQGLGSLWDTSRALTPLRKIQISGISGIRGNSHNFALLGFAAWPWSENRRK